MSVELINIEKEFFINDIYKARQAETELYNIAKKFSTNGVFGDKSFFNKHFGSLAENFIVYSENDISYESYEPLLLIDDTPSNEHCAKSFYEVTDAIIYKELKITRENSLKDPLYKLKIVVYCRDQTDIKRYENLLLEGRVELYKHINNKLRKLEREEK